MTPHPRAPELDGRVAIVTGAAKGMGEAICAALAAEGARLVLAGRRLEPLQASAERLNTGGDELRAAALACDVTDERDAAQLAPAACEVFGRIDILVNTAGAIGPIETPAQNLSAEDFRSVLDVNLVGTFLACKAVIPTMLAQQHGRILNISGTSGLRGYRNRAGYSASKWAVRGLTRTLALELGPHNITVNDICPNATHGARMDKIVNAKAQHLGKSYEEVYAEYAGQTALRRFIDAEDVAQAVLYLAGDRAANVTGHDLVVDAGWDL